MVIPETKLLDFLQSLTHLGKGNYSTPTLVFHVGEGRYPTPASLSCPSKEREQTEAFEKFTVQRHRLNKRLKPSHRTIEGFSSSSISYKRPINCSSFQPAHYIWISRKKWQNLLNSKSMCVCMCTHACAHTCACTHTHMHTHTAVDRESTRTRPSYSRNARVIRLGI